MQYPCLVLFPRLYNVFILILLSTFLLFVPVTTSFCICSLTINSPCGKKFRSKPQIARFLGETADLGCFDFSRAGTPGDGSQRRRARDRSAKKNIEPINKQIPPVRPLTNNPLRPSGPIRRTCGVIKLPVIWVAPPTDDDLKNDVMSTPLSLPAHPIGQVKPLEAPKPPQQVTTLVAPVGSSSAELVVPAMWENRLVGVKPCDHETGMEIVVTVNKPQNGLSVCGAGAVPADGVNGELSSSVIQNSPTLQSLIRQQQQQQQQQQKKTNLMTTLSQAQASLQGNTTQSLLQSLKSQQKQLASTSALLTQQGMTLTGASLSNLLRHQQQQQQQQQGSLGVTVTSGRTMTPPVNSTALGSVSSIGMAATGNGRLSDHKGGAKLGGGGHIHHTSSTNNQQQQQQQGHLSNKDLIKLSLTGGAASTMTNPFGSNPSIVAVSNGPTTMNNDASDGVAGATAKYVSDSEIQIQEEKVRQLRQQLLAAAQAAAKGSTVV